MVPVHDGHPYIIRNGTDGGDRPPLVNQDCHDQRQARHGISGRHADRGDPDGSERPDREDDRSDPGQTGRRRRRDEHRQGGGHAR